MESDSLDEIKQKLPALLPRLWRFAMTLTRNHSHAEELVQAACLRMLEKAHAYRPNTHLDRWAFTVMANLRRSELRRTRTEPVDDDAFLEAADETQRPDEKIYHDQVIAAVHRLPLDHRAVVALVCGEGYTYQETADILGVPVGTIMSRLHAARRRLRPLAGEFLKHDE